MVSPAEVDAYDMSLTRTLVASAVTGGGHVAFSRECFPEEHAARPVGR